MIELDSKAGTKFVKMLITLVKGIKNQNSSVNMDSCIMFDKGNFMYKEMERLPQLIYGSINYGLIKKDNKDLTKGDKAIVLAVQEVFDSIKEFPIKLQDVYDLETNIKGLKLDSITVNDSEIIMKYKDAPDKKNPDKVINDHTFILNKKNNIYEQFVMPNEDDIIEQEDITGELDMRDFVSSGELVEVSINDITTNLNNRNILYLSKQNTFTKIRLWEDNGEITLVSIVSEPIAEYFNYDSSDIIMGSVESFYRVVKIRD